MMKTTKYQTAQGPDSKSLDVKVNQLIKEGYILYGDPYIADHDTLQFCQAMVLEQQD